MAMEIRQAATGSDDTTPSTPNERDDPIFSDAPHRTSSPPSSPPTFPWESQDLRKESPSRPERPPRDAFSVLGKRKALHQLSDNARLPKRQSSNPTMTEQKPLSQMQISLGQEVQKKCKTCGMEYIASSVEDRVLHDKYHKQHAEGCDVGKDFLKKARDRSLFKAARAEDTIAVIGHFDNAWRRKRARAALNIAQRELGAVDILDAQLWDSRPKHHPPMSGIGKYAMYMYIRGTKCIGLLLTEQIETARKVVRPEKPVKESDIPAQPRRTSALSALRERHSSVHEAVPPDQPIELSQKSVPAALGISRIWTSPLHRNQGIAKALLDTALSHHNQQVAFHNESVNEGPSMHPRATDRQEADGTPAMLKKLDWKMEIHKKERIAFSQPTVAGAKLARRWFGKSYEWLVYID